MLPYSGASGAQRVKGKSGVWNYTGVHLKILGQIRFWIGMDKSMGGTAAQAWGKTSDEGTTETQILEEEKGSMQLSTLCAWSREDRTEVLRCMRAFFS